MDHRVALPISSRYPGWYPASWLVHVRDVHDCPDWGPHEKMVHLGDPSWKMLEMNGYDASKCLKMVDPYLCLWHRPWPVDCWHLLTHEAMKPWSHDAWASRSPLHVASLVVRTVEGGSTCRRQTGMIQNGWQPVRMTDIHGYPDRNLTKSRSTQCHNLGSQFFLSTQYQAPSRIMLNPRSKQRSMERTHRPWVKSHGLVAVQVDMRKWPIRRKKGW